RFSRDWSSDVCSSDLAAILYGVITFATGNEYGILSALIGIAVAFGFSRFGHTQGWLAGGIAAVIAAVLYIVAIFIGMAGLLSKEIGRASCRERVKVQG